MDAHARWTRRFLVPRLVVRVTLELVIVAEILLLAFILLGIERVLAVSWALVAAQALMIFRVGTSLYTNPIGFGYLKQYLADDLSLTTARIQPATGDLVEFLDAHNMTPLVTVHAAGVDHPRAHVYQSPDRYVLAAVSDDVPLPLFLSRLDDGRLLVTSNQLVPPHSKLVVNHVRRRSRSLMLEAHVSALERLYSEGIAPAADGAEAVADLFATEHDAWSDIGPFLGPFLAIGSRWKPLMLQVRIPAETLFERTLQPASERLRGPALVPPQLDTASVLAEVVGLPVAEDESAGFDQPAEPRGPAVPTVSILPVPNPSPAVADQIAGSEPATAITPPPIPGRPNAA